MVVFNVKRGRPTELELQKAASYRTSTAPIDITVTGNIIAVADLMKSVSLVEFAAGQDGLPDSLTEVGRHYQTLWSTALACVEKDCFLVADAEGNLVVLNRNVNGVTADDKRRLEVTGEFRLGEMVNRIQPVNIQPSVEPRVVPRAIVATVCSPRGSFDIPIYANTLTGRWVNISLRIHQPVLPRPTDAPPKRHRRSHRLPGRSER